MPQQAMTGIITVYTMHVQDFVCESHIKEYLECS